MHTYSYEDTRTDQTGAKSDALSPLCGAPNRDETAGRHPWVYKVIVDKLIRRPKGDQCGICYNV